MPTWIDAKTGLWRALAIIGGMGVVFAAIHAMHQSHLGGAMMRGNAAWWGLVCATTAIAAVRILEVRAVALRTGVHKLALRSEINALGTSCLIAVVAGVVAGALAPTDEAGSAAFTFAIAVALAAYVFTYPIGLWAVEGCRRVPDQSHRQP